MENENQSLPAAAHDPARLAEEVYEKMETPFNDCASSADADSDRALIAQAIAADRERCAKVCDNCRCLDPFVCQCSELAVEIRSGK